MEGKMKGEKIFEAYAVEMQYQPEMWTTVADCISTYKAAEKHTIKNDPNWRIVKVEKFLTD